MDKEKALVGPGTELAYSEEYLPGDGIYDDGERLRAAVFGTMEVDPKTMQLRVDPAGRSVARVEKGDIVVGEITYIRPELASVKILAVRGKEGRSMHDPVEATLHVSKADVRYTEDLTKLFQGGDIIRAKVIGLRGGPQLATDKPDFGAIRCRSGDGHVMERDGNRVRDPETGRIENRKLADDYGSGRI